MSLTGEGTPVAATVEEARALLSANLASRDQLLALDLDLDREQAKVEAQIEILSEQAKQIGRSQDTIREYLRNATGERNRLLNQAAQTLPFEEAFAVCAEFSGDPEEVVAQERALVEHLNSLSEQQGSFPALIFSGESDDNVPCVMVLTMSGSVRFEHYEGLNAESRRPRLCIDATGKEFFKNTRRDSELKPQDVSEGAFVDARTIITDPVQIMALMEQKLPVLAEEHSVEDERNLSEEDFVLLTALFKTGLLSETQINAIRSSAVVLARLGTVLMLAFNNPSARRTSGNMVEATMFFYSGEDELIAKELFLKSLKQALGQGGLAKTMSIAEVTALAGVANKYGLTVTTGEIIDRLLAED